MNYMTVALGYLYLTWAYILWRNKAPFHLTFTIVFCAVGMFVCAALEACGIKLP